MSLDASQKSVNGVEAPQQDPPATSATEPTAIEATNKNESPDASSSLNKGANGGKDAINGTADTESVTAGQPLEAAKPKEPVEPTKPVQSDEPLPSGESGIAGTGTEAQKNGLLTAQDIAVDDGAKNAEKMEVDSSEKKLPINDPTTIGDVPNKDSEGQDVDHVKAKDLASVQETAKHGHDNDQAAEEEQPPAKKQKTAPVKESNGADTTKTPKRGASQKKKEPKKATTEDGQPRRSSRLAI